MAARESPEGVSSDDAVRCPARGKCDKGGGRQREPSDHAPGQPPTGDHPAASEIRHAEQDVQLGTEMTTRELHRGGPYRPHSLGRVTRADAPRKSFRRAVPPAGMARWAA